MPQTWADETGLSSVSGAPFSVKFSSGLFPNQVTHPESLSEVRPRDQIPVGTGVNRHKHRPLAGIWVTDGTSRSNLAQHLLVELDSDKRTLVFLFSFHLLDFFRLNQYGAFETLFASSIWGC